MNHIYKLLNKITFILLLLSVVFSKSNPTVLDSISMALHQEGGLTIEATLEQSQTDNNWTDYITIEIVDSTKFIVIGTEQTLKVDTDTIYTYTSETNQLVIDRYYRNDFNLLSILSGNMRQIEVVNIQKRIRDTIIDCTVPNFESRGKIWINSKNYYPIKILLEDDLGNNSTISIDTIEPLGLSKQYDEYILDGWEIIDLRE